MAFNTTEWRAQVVNGKIPLHLLDKVVPDQFDPDLGGPALAHPEAAAAMSQLLEDAKKAGHTSLRVKFSYRTFAKQEEKWANFQAGGNLAARPGTSNHGWAVAFDLSWLTEAAIDWAHSNAAKYGFVFNVPSERWHIVYEGGFEMDDKRVDEILEGLTAFLSKDEPNQDGIKRRTYRALKAAQERATASGSGVSKAEYSLHEHGEGRTGPPVAP